ncbi:SHOCT domain-containing protein [Rhodococcus sp. NPDC056743]|uniref:SHOCT domain-containing protein n=1 Tax=Rhodococcus sp. NPDC056743 TaxID=3345934 RepID=UPI0036724901
MESFWEFFWFVFVCFAFVAYLSVLFSIITDLFRDHEMSGWAKAVWIIFLFVIPFLSAMIYVIVRNDGMTQRSLASAHQRMNAQGVDVRDVSGQSPARQISAAKGLLDSGAINEEEFRALKAKTIMQ